MLTVTRAALDRLSQKLDRRNAADDVVLRFTRRARGWKLSPDRERTDDTAITHEGRNVLLLDRAVAQAMSHMTLDARMTDAGPRLTLRKPAPSEE